MGGTTETITKYYKHKKNITDYITNEKFVTCTYHEVVNKNNYKDKLKKYNLSESEIKKIETSFNCSSRKMRRFNNNYFIKETYSIFQMAMNEFFIKTNMNNEKEIIIKKKSLKLTINNPYTIIEKANEGWGLLFFISSKTQTEERRRFKLSEMEELKLSMQNKLKD